MAACLIRTDSPQVGRRGDGLVVQDLWSCRKARGSITAALTPLERFLGYYRCRLLTHIFWGAENLSELADGAQFTGQAEVYDLNVP